jgi:hypothetical protein
MVVATAISTRNRRSHGDDRREKDVSGVGFVAIRKEAGLLPGPKATVQAGQDYRGERHRLRMQRILDPAERVLLVDDWAERGSQALAAKELVEACGAHYVGATLIVDQLETETRAALQRLTSLLTADELGRSTLRSIGSAQRHGGRRRRRSDRSLRSPPTRAARGSNRAASRVTVDLPAPGIPETITQPDSSPLVIRAIVPITHPGLQSDCRRPGGSGIPAPAGLTGIVREPA